MQTRYCSAPFRLSGDQLSRIATMEGAQFYEFIAFMVRVRTLAETYK